MSQMIPLSRIVMLTTANPAFMLLAESEITPMTAGNLPWHILFGFQSSAVSTTIARGRVLMRDRKLQFLDEAEIAARDRKSVV